MLLLLTASQLSILARIRYLQDVRAGLSRSDEGDSSTSLGETTPSSSASTMAGGTSRRSSGWLNYFSIESMGLSDFADEAQATVPNLLSFLPRAVSALFPTPAEKAAGSQPASMPTTHQPTVGDTGEIGERAEAERLFLTYSWWLLHEGWRGIGERVHEAVERVFSSVPLKREISVDEWTICIAEIRAAVETSSTENPDHLEKHDFTSDILPKFPVSTLPDSSPLPTHPDTSPHLVMLLDQTRQQLESPDGRVLLDKGVSEMIRKLLDSLRDECYVSEDGEERGRRRLVDCLPEINRWGKGVWEGVPDGGIEALLAIPDFESFAALIFGDWAPQ